MNIKLLSFSALVVFSVPTFGENYQVEISGLIGTGEQDSSLIDLDIFTYGIQGTVYLEEVDTSKGPLLVAPFLDKSSGIFGQYIFFDVDANNFDLTLESESYSAGIRFVASNNLILEGEFEFGETDVEGSTISSSTDNKVYSLGVGTYIGDNHSVSFSFSNQEITADNESIDDTRYSIDATGFYPANNNNGLLFNLGYSLIDIEDEDGSEIEVNIDYFINRLLNFGISYEIESIDSQDDTTTSIGAVYFFTEAISSTVEYTLFDSDSTDSTLFIFGLSARM